MPLLDQPKTREIYQSIKRSLRLKEGFGLFFIVCNPSQAQDITNQLKDDFGKLKNPLLIPPSPPSKGGNLTKIEKKVPSNKSEASISLPLTKGDKRGITKGDFGKLKNIETLTLTAEVPELHSRINAIKQTKPVDILLISGIEKSFDPYIKSGTEADEIFGGRGGYYQLDSVSLPPLLSHLNLQREHYKQSFPFALVFFLSPFAYSFLVRRAPDFFDWRSGIFEIPRDPQEVELEARRIIAESDYNEYLTWTPTARYHEIERVKSLIKEPFLAEESKKELYFELGLLYTVNEDYDYAIQSYDQALKFQPDYSDAWNNRGNALDKLGRYEEAIESYDQALKFQPDDSDPWTLRGITLQNLGRNEEAIQSFDQALKFQPDDSDPWTLRGITLQNLGRNEEAIQSFDQAIKLNPNNYNFLFKVIIKISSWLLRMGKNRQ